MSDSSSSDCEISSDSDEEENESEDIQEQDQIDFSCFPYELQCSVVEKFKPKAFIRFDESSRFGHSLCWSKLNWIKFSADTLHIEKARMRLKVVDDIFFDDKFRIPYEDTFNSPFRITLIRIYIDDVSRSRIQEVTTLLEAHKSTTMGLELLGDVNFEAADLETLITITRPRDFWCHQFLPRQFLQLPCLQSMRHLDLEQTGCTDEELQHLKASHLCLEGNITLRGLHNCLKQWRKNERKIGILRLVFDTPFDPSDFDMIYDGVEANPVWTPALHSDSILAPIPIENVYHMGNNDPEYLYSLWKPGKHDRGLFIEIKRGYFHATTLQDEAAYLHRFLTDEEYYKVRNECLRCLKQFCEHWPSPADSI